MTILQWWLFKITKVNLFVQEGFNLVVPFYLSIITWGCPILLLGVHNLKFVCNSVISILLTSIGYFTLSEFLLTWNGVISHGQESGLVHQSKQGKTKFDYWFITCHDKMSIFPVAFFCLVLISSNVPWTNTWVKWHVYM